jgi:hypothetical protein
MKNRLAAVLLILMVLSAAVPLMGQSRGRRGTPRSDETPQARGASPSPQPAAPPEPTPEHGSSPQGAGKDTPPRQGYVPLPEPARPGTLSGAITFSDPLERGTWEFYERDGAVTVTGKVTRVDWTNPNTYIYLSADGGLWAIESGFSQFLQSSVTPAVKEGQIITVLGYLPKEQNRAELPARRVPATASYLRTNHLIRAGEITTAFGQTLLMGRPPSEAELAERLRCTALGC